ncbi:phasin family protein [Dyella humicola]|uniref:phasin family protein n=1 Tax=Dyella humicola TaxID=2992126 RepID=UPI0022520527|nr:phasin family protein [Dyella humicola]
MSNPSDLPLSLYKANTEFQLRVSKLVMENWKKWLELSSRAVDDGISESQARVEHLLKAQDWTALASMPGETFWRLLQQRVGDTEVNNQIAANVQAHFAQGLQEAIMTWQKDTSSALGSVGDVTASSAPWNDVMAQWGKLWPMAGGPGGKGPARDK